MAYGKLIELFLVKGTTDNLTTAELSNYGVTAIDEELKELKSMPFIAMV